MHIISSGIFSRHANDSYSCADLTLRKSNVCICPRIADREYMLTSETTQTTYWLMSRLPSACQTLFVIKRQTQFPEAMSTAVAPLSNTQMLHSGVSLKAKTILYARTKTQMHGQHIASLRSH